MVLDKAKERIDPDCRVRRSSGLRPGVVDAVHVERYCRFLFIGTSRGLETSKIANF